jgi:hypothetical protein
VSNFRFVICPVLQPGSPIGELWLSTVSFNDPVTGTGGTFTGKLEVSADTKDALKVLTEPFAVALYVYDNDSGAYLWGGPLVERPWNSEERRLSLGAISWKSWLYLKQLNPDFSVNPPVDKIYSQTATDQFTIARYILGFVNADHGTPHINLGIELSGVNRDFSTQGTQFKYVGELIDSMANRDNGFDWNIAIESDSNGNPSLWFRPYWPKRGSVNSTVILLNEQPTGGNILSFSDQNDSAAALRTRCWATGAGQPPDMIFAYDEDPALSGGFVLLTERVDNYSTVSDIATLAQHARTARKYYGQARSTVTPKLGMRDPDHTIYGSGDKVRLRVLDDWWDYDLAAARIIDKQYNVNNEGDSPAPDTVSLTIDLTDTQLPQDDEQV